MTKYRSLFVAAIILLGVSEARAQEAEPMALEGVVRFGDGTTGKFKAAVESPVVVRDESVNISYSFLIFRDAHSGAIDLRAYDPKAIANPWTVLMSKASTASSGLRRLSIHGSGVSVDLQVPDIEPLLGDHDSKGEVDAVGATLLKSGVCCVTCGLRTICAAEVIMSCGSCSASSLEPENNLF